MSTSDTPPPGFPAPVDPFTLVAPSHYRVVVRRAQHVPAKEIALELGLRPKTVNQYLERARHRLDFEDIASMLQQFVWLHAPKVWAAGEGE